MKYIIISLATLLITCGIYAYSLKNDLRDSVKSNIAYENAINYQNSELKRQIADKEKALKKIEEWKLLPAVEKWQTLTKIIYRDVNISSEGVNCDQNKIIESNVYNLDWNNF
tara:strand:+ start:454 stop:789 length:336 start_codon:yes stop_codon:yes gene_type:complete